MKAKCKQCGFYDDADKFEPTMSVYHDMRCPKCGTTAIDTSEINAAWKQKGDVYGYGDNNFMS
jgi:predicted Zn-ribbon and HTH transcriptional regulator